MKSKREIFEKEGYYNKWTVAICLCGNEVEFGHKSLSLFKLDGRPRIPGYSGEKQMTIL